MVEVSRLIDPACLVEIEADARLGWREVADPAASEPEDRELGIAEAAFNDASDIAALLERAGLPVPGPQDRPVRFLVARAAAGVAACVGWEAGDGAALLRSCAVAAAERGQGRGSELVRALGRRLQAEGLDAVYLLTLDAQGFFRRFGFAECPREAVPPSLARSREFEIHHCDAAACMRAELPLTES
jgi:N-acetylglutamate synthase-like GNAT family acetyltransferase